MPKSPNLDKLRSKINFADLLFIADDLKLKGNEAYDQGSYYKALDIYE